MNRSVENRFFAIVCAALLVFVSPLFVLFLFLSSERAQKEMKDHISVLVAANAQALAKPLWDLDEDTVTQISATTVSEGAAIKVNVQDSSGHFDVTQSRLPKAFKGRLISISQPIVYETISGPRTLGSITVFYPELGLFGGLNHQEIVFISIFVFAVLTVFGTAVLGNRILVIHPLMRLTFAIEATRRLGSRHHVDWHSNDEMGRLAQSFNDMQSKLEREENELKTAHQAATDTYNLTPAMLFSLDAQDRITAVSDYWLAATGYAREEVLNRDFATLVCSASRLVYKERKASGIGASRIETTVKFIRRDQTTMDVLILENETAETGLSLSVMTDVTKMKEAEHQSHMRALTDYLTGLPNRLGFEAALAEKIAEADRSQQQLACLFLDLDRFKWINDNLGHSSGDAALRELVGRLEKKLNQGDVAARLGGDEFAILTVAPEAEPAALALVKRILTIFELPFVEDARLSASIGVAIYPRDAADAAELLQKSDMAMYAKKRDGKNGAEIFNVTMMDHAKKRAEIEIFIENGLANDWFEPYLQPIVDINDRSIKGFEALMRLHHPKHGVMAPGTIVEVAEETGAIDRIGDRIMEKAIASLRRISRIEGFETSYMAINFSPLQFNATLPIRLASLLERAEIAPSRIVVEITEAVLMNDNPAVRNAITELCRFGCRIALDDFGTGYSSLSYINRFPVDIIKVDQSFTRAITDENEDVRHKSRMLVEAITTLSHKMNCPVVAEGIETEETLQTLQSMGLDFGQGYLFYRPQQADRLIDQLQDLDMQQRARLAAS